MTKVLGLEIYTVIAGATLIALLAVFIVPLLAGPSAILDSAFGLLGQTVSTASIVVNGLVAGSGVVATQGMALVSTAIAQAGNIFDNSIVAATAATNTVLDVAATGIQSAVHLTTAVAAAGLQVATQLASAAVTVVSQFAVATTQMFLSVAQFQIYVGATITQMGIIALSNYAQAAFQAITQIWTTLFTSLSALAGQLLSIPMIMVFGYTSIASALVGVVPEISAALVAVFIKLFTLTTEVFTDPTKFLARIADIPTTIGAKILEGFGNLLNGLGDELKEVFLP